MVDVTPTPFFDVLVISDPPQDDDSTQMNEVLHVENPKMVLWLDYLLRSTRCERCTWRQPIRYLRCRPRHVYRRLLPDEMLFVKNTAATITFFCNNAPVPTDQADVYSLLLMWEPDGTPHPPSTCRHFLTQLCQPRWIQMDQYEHGHKATSLFCMHLLKKGWYT